MIKLARNRRRQSQKTPASQEHRNTRPSEPRPRRHKLTKPRPQRRKITPRGRQKIAQHSKNQRGNNKERVNVLSQLRTKPRPYPRRNRASARGRRRELRASARRGPIAILLVAPVCSDSTSCSCTLPAIINPRSRPFNLTRIPLFAPRRIAGAGSYRNVHASGQGCPGARARARTGG